MSQTRNSHNSSMRFFIFRNELAVGEVERFGLIKLYAWSGETHVVWLLARTCLIAQATYLICADILICGFHYSAAFSSGNVPTALSIELECTSSPR